MSGILRGKSGRGTTRRENLVWGLSMISVICILLGIFRVSLTGGFSDTATVKATFDTVGGSLKAGADVKLRGVLVGKVSAVEGDARHIELTLRMQSRSLAQVPSDVRARVLPATVFGTSFVDLTTSSTATRSLSAGDVIAQDTSVPTLELQRALDSIDNLVKALGPAELATTLGSLAGALEGRGEQLGQTLTTLNSYLGKVNPLIPVFRDDLRLLANNLDTVRTNAPALFDSIDNGLVVAGHLVERQAQLTMLVAGSIAVVGDANRFLGANGERLVQAINGAAAVLDALFDQRAGIGAGLSQTARLVAKVPALTSGGPLRVRIVSGVNDPSRFYTRADCPRYGNQSAANCPTGERSSVERLVAGSLLREQRESR